MTRSDQPTDPTDQAADVQAVNQPDWLGTVEGAMWRLHFDTPAARELDQRRSSSSSDRVSVLFLAELGAIVSLVTTGYNLIGNPNDSVGRVLNRVNDTIGAVQSRVDAVSRRVVELFDVLDRLEMSIKGHITQTLLLDIQGIINSRRIDIERYMRDEQTLRRDLPEARAAVADLQTQILRIASVTGHQFGAAFALAPAMMLWTQSFMAIQRVRGLALAEPVWDDPMHRDVVVRTFSNIFAMEAQLRPNLEAELRAMPQWGPGLVSAPLFRLVPQPGSPYGGQFFPTGQSVRLNTASPCIPVERGAADLYFAASIGSQANERIFAAALGGCLPPLPGPPPNPAPMHWKAIERPDDFPDPTRARQAKFSYEAIEARRVALISHFNMFKDVAHWRTVYEEEVAVKPATWGGTAAPRDHVVTLYNNTWPQVNVEVRRGVEGDCGLNAAFDTRELERSENWSIPTPQVDLCYRRDVDPNNPNGQWTSWRRISYDPANPYRLVQIQ